MSTSLVIIFNHNYEANIPILEELYSKKFDEVFFLMPFYRGNKENVFSVSGNSFYFQSYIAQTSSKIMSKSKADRFLFIADDMILNPAIDDTNVCEFLKIPQGANFIPRLASLATREKYWSHALNAVQWRSTPRGIEVSNYFPDINETLIKFKTFGNPSLDVSLDALLPRLSIQEARYFTSNPKYFVKFLFGGITRLVFKLFAKRSIKAKFPFYYSYSDFFVVTRDTFEEFSWYLSLFSSTELFVELAIPTALCLASDQIETEESTGTYGRAIWPNSFGRMPELEKYDWDFQRLMREYPAECLYLHPIKLSKWRNINDES